jgi:hypothetical protein
MYYALREVDSRAKWGGDNPLQAQPTGVAARQSHGG